MPPKKQEKYDQVTVTVIETNIDDMNPELYDYLVQKLLKNGASDVFLSSILMKKNRPGVLLKVTCNAKDKEKLCSIIFEETTTFGIRISEAVMRKLQRSTKTIKTKYGVIKINVGSAGSKTITVTPEYADCLRIAKTKGLPLQEVLEEANKKITAGNAR